VHGHVACLRAGGICGPGSRVTSQGVHRRWGVGGWEGRMGRERDAGAQEGIGIDGQMSHA
jgi:hypothetical protein